MIDPWVAEPFPSFYLAMVAGYAGAVVWLSVSDTALTFLRTVSTLVAGSLTAAYVAPAVGTYYRLSPVTIAAAGFVLGLMTFVLVPGVLRLAEKVVKDPIGFYLKWRETSRKE